MPVARAGVLGLGVLLPGLLYLARPSLLLDEARLALNIGARSWVGLTQALDYDQTAPLLFLWAAKLATVLGGVNEYTLRAAPFAAAAALPALLWLVGRRLMDEAAAVMAAALATLSPLMLQYCRQVKPYTLDAVVALVLLWLGLSWLDAPKDQRCARRMAMAGILAPWFSVPAAFVLAGVLAVVATLPERRRPSLRVLALLISVWGVSLFVAYVWIYRPAAENPYMAQFWRASLLSIGEPGFFSRLWQGTREVFWQTFVGGTTETFVALGLVDELADPACAALLAVWLFGLWRAARWTAWRRWALVVAPVGVALAASCVGKYPIAARTMLFAVPALTLGISAGWLALARAVPPQVRPAVGALTGMCLIGPQLVLDNYIVHHRRSFENVEDAVAEYQRHHAPGESIYVFTAALPAWTFYTTDWRRPDQVRLARMARLGSSGGPAFENAAPRQHAIGVEGDSLSYALGDFHEIIGLYHGAQVREAGAPAQNAPDTNWTTNEGRRIRNAANPSVWVLTIRAMGLERFLYAASGLCLDGLYQRDGFALARLSVAQVCKGPSGETAGQ